MRKARKQTARVHDGRTIPSSPIVDPREQLLTQNDVCALLRCSRQTLWHWRRFAGFPLPFIINNAVGTGSPRWRRAEIETFLESRRADRVVA